MRIPHFPRNMDIFYIFFPLISMGNHIIFRKHKGASIKLFNSLSPDALILDVKLIVGQFEDRFDGLGSDLRSPCCCEHENAEQMIRICEANFAHQKLDWVPSSADAIRTYSGDPTTFNEQFY